MKKDVVLIKKPECLSCYYLSNINSTKHPCHKDSDCPAKFYEMVIGLPMTATAKNLSKALAKNDVEKISRIMKRLNKVHPTVKNNILNKAKSFMNK